MTITKDLIEQFKQYVFSTFSAGTARSYSVYVSKFCLGKTIDQVNSLQFFLDLKLWCTAEGLALNTIGNYVISCKKFLRYIEDFYGLEIINLDKIKCKRPVQREVNFLEREEVQAIKEVSTHTISGILDRALFEFYLHTGCRVSEGVSLDWKNIDFKKGEVEVIGKGNKARTVFLGESVHWIQKYLAERKNTSAPLFLTQCTSANGERLSKKNAFIRIRNLGRRANLTRDIFPHLLRATYCTYLIRSKVDPKTVQHLMGHEDLETTLRYYYAVTKESMREAHVGLEIYLKSPV